MHIRSIVGVYNAYYSGKIREFQTFVRTLPGR